MTTASAGPRVMSVLLALDIARDFVTPALWIVGETTSVISTTARLATFPELLALAWLLAALMVLPYILMQVFSPDCRWRRKIIKIGCNGVCLGGVMWVYLAYLSKNLDYGIATSTFIGNGISSVALGAVLAWGLNKEQINTQNTIEEGNLA